MLLSGESLTPSRIGQFQALFFLLESTFLADIGVILVLWLSRVQLFAIPLAAAQQASLSFTISQTLLKLMSIELVMPSNYLILCHPLILLPPIFPSIRVFSSESALCIRWLKYWSSRSMKFTTHPKSLKLRRPLDINFMPSAVDQRNTDQKSQLFPPPSSPKIS